MLRYLLGALLASGAAAQEALAAGVAVVPGTDKTNEAGVYRFATFLTEGDTIRAYFPEEIEFTGAHAIIGGVEYCSINSGMEYDTLLDNCTYNPGSNSVEIPIPEEQRPQGFFIFEIGGFRNPATSGEYGGFSIQVLGPLRGVRYESTTMLPVEIVPNDLNNLTLLKVPGTVGDTTSFTTLFQTTNEIPLGGYVQVSM